jgi:hypothetical protein
MWASWTPYLQIMYYLTMEVALRAVPYGKKPNILKWMM